MSRQSKWVLSIVMLVVLWTSFPVMTNTQGYAETESFSSVSYNIKPGDTLYGIAKKFYLTGDYEQVARTNGLDPKVSLKAGTALKLSNPLVLDQYTVKQGDTLYAITNHYFNRVYYMNALMAYNHITEANLKAEMALRVPLPAGELKYTVHKGDTLYSLSAKYFNVQDYQQMIAKVNGIETTSASIKAGQVVQIPNPFYSIEECATVAAPQGTTAVTPPASASASAKLVSIEIDITRNKLYVIAGGAVEKTFDIASGKKGSTPTGSFEIITKIKNPWYMAKEIPGGDPKNPLGSRWLGLSVPNTQGTKYGIHGTNAPSSIGTNASAGCIRMLNKDVEWLFGTVPTGTKVKIHA
ncbi:Lipoprotein-anchoring transpeptidase ErfK/SrfK [Paenibacillus sp. BC26]|nr:Lipoprotein-anchoring transpeptidase ErfK/SrfK [Paenibacillus sp. BC26]